MNFKYSNGLVWTSIEIVYEGIQVKIDDCIIDTGSATTAFDIDLVNFNYNKNVLIRRLSGIGGGSQEVLSQEIDKVIIDNISLSGINIEFGDISNSFGINGFIGNNILSKFNFSINFSDSRIIFNKKK